MEHARIKSLAIAALLVFCALLGTASADVPAAVLKARESVVVIVAIDAKGEPLAYGSGFIVRADGVIVTNCHVIEGASSALVKDSRGTFFPVKGVMGFDVASDIAVLKVVATRLPSLVIGDSWAVETGDSAYAIGNPLALEGTVSEGIVSGLRDFDGRRVFQVSTPISEGSSGGPLLNARGEVIGITSFFLAEGQALNFAVPISVARLFLKSATATPLPIGLTVVPPVSSGPSDQPAVPRRSDEKEAISHFLLSQGAATAGRDAEAMGYAQKSLDAAPESHWGYFALGFAHDRAGRNVEAIAAYQECIRRKPDYLSVAYFNLGVVCARVDHFADAVVAYQETIRLKPDDAEAYINLSAAYQRLGRYAESVTACQEAIRLRPDGADAYFNLGIACRHLGRYAEAVTACQQAIRLRPDDAKAHTSLGAVYADLDRHGDAVAEFQEAIRLKPDYALAHFNLGIVFLAMGRRADALEEYRILKVLNRDLADQLFKLIYPD